MQFGRNPKFAHQFWDSDLRPAFLNSRLKLCILVLSEYPGSERGKSAVRYEILAQAIFCAGQRLRVQVYTSPDRRFAFTRACHGLHQLQAGGSSDLREGYFRRGAACQRGDGPRPGNGLCSRHGSGRPFSAFSSAGAWPRLPDGFRPGLFHRRPGLRRTWRRRHQPDSPPPPKR